MERVSFRVVSKRKFSSCQAKPGEVVWPIHRGNKILCNPFVMKDFSKEERARVIASFKELFDKDIAEKGPIYRELIKIVDYHLATGRTIALECWCAPEDCHGDLLIPILNEMLKGKKHEQHRSSKPA